MRTIYSTKAAMAPTGRTQKAVNTPSDVKSDALRVIRPELNLEKWPAIWQPVHSRNKLSEMVIERAFDHSTTAKVEITANSKYGPLTTETQKVWYGLIKLWEETGRSKRLYFSRRKIAKALGGKWGSNVKKLIENALYQLRATLFIWANAYYDSTTKKTIRELNTFTVLSDLKIIEEEVDGHTTTEACYCEFHELVFNNLVNGYTKPLLFDTIISFEDGIAQLLYTHLDLILSTKTPYERRTADLFYEELRLRGKEYRKASARERTLKRVLPKLDNKPLSKGGFLQLKVLQSKDGKDYKLVANRVQQLPAQRHADKEEQSTPETVSGQMLNRFTTADELVRHFLAIFKIGRQNPRPSEIEEAARLIADYQLDLAKGKYIVEFSKEAAKETNYSPKSFNGIVQYTDRALADYELRKKVRQEHQADEEAKIRQQEEECAKLAARLHAIPEGQYHTIYEIAKGRLLGEMPWLKDMQDSLTFRLALNQEMVYELEYQISR